MPTDSDILAWRDRLLEARFSGVLEVRDSNGESIRYRSGAELAAALIDLDNLIRRLGQPRPATTIYLNTSKGL